MIYWFQEATQAGTQVAGSSWSNLLLSAGVLGAVGSAIGLIFTQLRHIQTLRQTRDLEDTRRLEARELEDKRRLEARELEVQRASEAALQKYFEQMREALADPKRPLRRSTMGDSLSTIARAQTLAVLAELDPDRKRILLQFLYESNLINTDKPVISLVGANLRGANLQGANLRGANLMGAVLIEAILRGAHLREAILSDSFMRRDVTKDRRGDLTGADLSGADLIDANLAGALLHRANLSEAWLSRADLQWAVLEGANLSSAYLDGADLEEANLWGANLSKANLWGANLGGAKLREAKELTQQQIAHTKAEKLTELPDHLKRPEHWSKGEVDEI